jgi:hypothetical protein
MAVGASQPTVVGTKDGRIGIKNQMQVCHESILFHSLGLCMGFFGIVPIFPNACVS